MQRNVYWYLYYSMVQKEFINQDKLDNASAEAGNRSVNKVVLNNPRNKISNNWITKLFNCISRK